MPLGLLSDGAKKYYLYLKARSGPEAGLAGTLYLSETAMEFLVAGYYYLLVGTLGSEYNGDRSFVSMYGFTEVLPGQITTRRIVSPDGRNYIDLLNNAFRVGNSNASIEFNTASDGVLRLKGVTKSVTAFALFGRVLANFRFFYYLCTRKL
jgi:hypothetical protein